MSKYQEYANKVTEFLALTAYTRQEFDKLLPHFRRCYDEWMKSHRLDGKPRGNRKYSDYKNSPLPTIEDKLFFILHYLKTNNLQAVQGALFGMSQPKANLWIHCLHPILNQTLAELGDLPVRQMAKMTFAEGEETLYFHDGTERPIPRPGDLEQQRWSAPQDAAPVSIGPRRAPRTGRSLVPMDPRKRCSGARDASTRTTRSRLQRIAQRRRARDRHDGRICSDDGSRIESTCGDSRASWGAANRVG